ncbi:MAG: hypothetical protein ACLUFV_14005, partial [Acutalibacteraceae bacterium]
MDYSHIVTFDCIFVNTFFKALCFCAPRAAENRKSQPAVDSFVGASCLHATALLCYNSRINKKRCQSLCGGYSLFRACGAKKPGLSDPAWPHKQKAVSEFVRRLFAFS